MEHLSGDLYTVPRISRESHAMLPAPLATSRVYKWITSGKLHAIRIGGRVYVRGDELRRVVPLWGNHAG